MLTREQLTEQLNGLHQQHGALTNHLARVEGAINLAEKQIAMVDEAARKLVEGSASEAVPALEGVAE